MNMDHLRPVDIVLRPVELEAADRIHSASHSPEPVEQRFLEACRYYFPPDVYPEMIEVLAFAKSLRSTDPNHPSMRAYFSHPLRVATFVLRLMKVPSRNAVTTGLIHNVFEVSGLSEDELISAGFSKKIADGIRLLTIDRAQQYEPKYLKDFYQRIERFGDELVLVKCVDRLDNLLAFELLDKTPTHELYIDLSEQFVVPLAHKLAVDFGEYLERVVAYARASSANRNLQEQYQTFLAQSAASPQN